jgi:CO dehydrogenase/acetyl-CoA synthase gamma subunit (corrinoid Fe-S protein)
VDKRGSGDNNGGSPVMVTTNFGSLTTYYVKSNAF